MHHHHMDTGQQFAWSWLAIWSLDAEWMKLLTSTGLLLYQHFRFWAFPFREKNELFRLEYALNLTNEFFCDKFKIIANFIVKIAI